MIKKILIEEYGPFKNAEINLFNDSQPVYIIGMNDVGKTCLLTAIDAIGGALSNKYIKKNELGEKINSKVLITYKFKKEYYSDLLIKDLNEHFGGIFEGDINVSVNSADLNSKHSTSFFTTNSSIKIWVQKVINDINKFLTINNKIDSIDLGKSITNENLNRIKEAIISKTKLNNNDKLSIKMIATFISFKDLIYSITDKIIFIPANLDETFNFIKYTYKISDTTSSDGVKILSDWLILEKILIAFLGYEKTKNLKSILHSEIHLQEKIKRIETYSDEITEEMQTFFKENFPSQNKDIKFKLRMTGNDVSWLIKDSTSDYEPLSKRSDGFKWFLKLYIDIKFIERNSIFVIDEPEKFLHASAQINLKKLFEKLKLKYNLQIIYATHSPFMLSDSIFENVKIIEKSEIQSQIYNNVNSFIQNSGNKNYENVLLPIARAMGLPFADLLISKDIYQKTTLLVEGEADISTIKLAAYLSNKNIDNLFIWHLNGDKNYCPITTAKALNLSHKVFLDGQKREIRFKNGENVDNVYFLSEIFPNTNVVDPEDLLSETTMNEFGLNKNLEKHNHKIGWKSLYDSVISNKKQLDSNEIRNLQQYIEGVFQILEFGVQEKIIEVEVPSASSS